MTSPVRLPQLTLTCSESGARVVYPADLPVTALVQDLERRGRQLVFTPRPDTDLAPA